MTKHVTNVSPTWPMASEAVNFKNGMIVTADDLRAAMEYPVALMQATNRAVYGCGVVCGFDIKPDPGLCGESTTEEICIDGNDKSPVELYRSFRLEIGHGTAMDCSGLPIELCKPLLIDLSPDKCGCDPKTGGTVCILIRRISVPEGPRGDCCGTPSGPPECSRIRDHVELRAVPKGSDEWPDHVCMRKPKSDKDGSCGCGDGGTSGGELTRQDPRIDCTCLKTCDCCCCGEGWVLLGCVELTSHGIRAWTDNEYETDIILHRKYIKTIECLCPPPALKTLKDQREMAAETAQSAAKRDPLAEQMLQAIYDNTTIVEPHWQVMMVSQPHDPLDLEAHLAKIAEMTEQARAEVYKKAFVDKVNVYREEVSRLIDEKGWRRS